MSLKSFGVFLAMYVGAKVIDKMVLAPLATSLNIPIIKDL